MKRKPEKQQKKDKYFRENIVVIEEEWFSDTNLIGSATFTPDLIKHSILRFIKKIYFYATQKDTYTQLKYKNFGTHT